MKLKKHAIFMALASFFLVGCSVTSPKLYQDKKPVSVVEPNYLKPLEQQPRIKTEFNILQQMQEKLVNKNNYVNSRASDIDLTKNQTVVIALPVEMEKNIFQEGVKALDTTKPFKTEGYISESEAIIEKELIRFGFNVIDRSKFEAKLRALRSNSVDEVGTKIYEAKLAQLEEQKKNKEIPEKEYLEELAKLDENQKRRSRGDNELIDMVELVRAAQSDGVQADYILQLNAIEEYNAYPFDIYLKNHPQIEQYLLQNPDLTYGENGIPEKFETVIFRVVFAAKLLNVATGQVIWSGLHELNSLNIEDYTVIFDILKEDVSTTPINADINNLNNNIKYKYKKAVDIYNILHSFYQKASKERTYKNKEEQSIGEANLIQEIHKLEKSLQDYNKEIDDFNMIPRNYADKISYKYTVSNLTQIPDLDPSNASTDKQKERNLSKHRQKLLSETVRSLFTTIRVIK